MGKWLCTECDELMTDAEMLAAPNPFDPAETVFGCRDCKSVNTMNRACDYPECAFASSSGTPLRDGGYTWRCHNHPVPMKERRVGPMKATPDARPTPAAGTPPGDP